ncbi:MAG: hypothetical protein R3C60_05985 [Parvularculaceae bacterium]
MPNFFERQSYERVRHGGDLEREDAPSPDALMLTSERASSRAPRRLPVLVFSGAGAILAAGALFTMLHG